MPPESIDLVYLPLKRDITHRIVPHLFLVIASKSELRYSSISYRLLSGLPWQIHGLNVIYLLGTSLVPLSDGQPVTPH